MTCQTFAQKRRAVIFGTRLEARFPKLATRHAEAGPLTVMHVGQMTITGEREIAAYEARRAALASRFRQ